jgi:hypothetical protein
MYVAAHIKSGQAVDSSYGDIAANALTIGGMQDLTGEECLNIHNIKDVDFLNAVQQADPDRIGKNLIDDFIDYDQATRDRASVALGGR